jgi:uncharacterized protein
MTSGTHCKAERLQVTDFDPERFARGRKEALLLELNVGSTRVELPVTLFRGADDGPVLAITAGVHGDEFQGVQAVLEMCAEADPAQMCGTVIAVPVANPPAFWNTTRTSPLDEGNLARAFPGRTDGTATEVIAFHLAHSVIARADFYVDLHTAGAKLLMPCMVGYDANDRRSAEAAHAFGAPVIWGHPSVAPGRTISFATSRGIPWLYTEAPGSGCSATEDVQIFKRGLINLQQHLGILRGRICATPAVKRVLFGDGDLDAAITATQFGFFMSSVELLQDVHKGQQLGRTIDLHSVVVERFESPRDGVVGMVRVFPVVRPGDSICLLTSG